MTAELIQWAIDNGKARIETGRVEVLIIGDVVYLDDTTVTDILQWKTNPNVVWQGTNRTPVMVLTEIVETRLSNLRNARNMLENKSFGVSIRAEQQEIDAESHKLRSLLP